MARQPLLRRWAVILSPLLLIQLCGCGLGGGSPAMAITMGLKQAHAPAPPAPADAPVPIDAIPYRLIASYPHDTRAFTEGLVFHHGELIESTGMKGESDIRRVRISDGTVIASVKIPPKLFGEGVATFGGTLYSLTWTSGRGFKWSLPHLKQIGKLSYMGQGWGMTSNAKNLIMSDGTPVVRFLDPRTFKTVRTLSVTANGKPLKNINELEWIDGQLYANVWQTRWIVRIDPESGAVTGAIDTQPLMEQAGGDLWNRTPNGIAWDAKTQTLYVTGKRWTKLYALKIFPETDPAPAPAQ